MTDPLKPNSVIITLPGDPAQHVVLQNVKSYEIKDEGTEYERLLVYNYEGEEIARYRRDGWRGIRWVRLSVSPEPPEHFPGEIVVDYLKGIPKPKPIAAHLPDWGQEYDKRLA